MKKPDLAGLIGARICHDLASPLGAIANGADLLCELRDAPHSDEIDLVAESARRASAILKLHRLTFGAVREPELVLDREVLSQQVNDVLASPRLTLDWSGIEGAPLPAAVARLLCLMLLCGKALSGRGGRLHTMLTSDAHLPVTLLVESQHLALTDDRRRWLAGEPGPGPDSRDVEFVLARQVADELGAALTVSEGDERMALRAMLR